MKKIYPLILVVFFQTSFSQSAEYFSSENSRWFVRYSYPHANEQNPFFIETKTQVYGFQGDTLVDGKIWRKMYHTTDSSFLNHLNFLGYLCFEKNLILFQEQIGITDTIYNFNLEVGDSVLYKLTQSDSTYISILEIDSIQIHNQYLKKYIFERISRPLCCFLEEIWIEGIGSIFGPLSPKYPQLIDIEFSSSHGLTCFYDDGGLIWQNIDYNNCYFQQWLGVAHHKSTTIEVFPNPFLNTITINSNIFTEKTIEIVNIYGQVVRSYDVQANEFTIDMSNMSCGIYFIRTRFDNSEFTSKIIKTY